MSSLLQPQLAWVVKRTCFFSCFLILFLFLSIFFAFTSTMAGNLRYTAAKTSVIGKRTGTTSAFDIKKLLPLQAKYQQNNRKRLQKDAIAAKTPTLATEALQVVDYNVELDYQLSRNESIMVAIDTVLGNLWTESSTLHARHHTTQTKQSGTPQELLFLLHGLSMQTKAEIIKYRSEQLPVGLVTVNQLYSVYEKLGHTFVDRNLELEIRKGNLKKMVITNASPVILRLPQKFQSGKVTYGFENVELVIQMKQYLGHLADTIAAQKASPKTNDLLQHDIETLHKFLEYVRANPAELYVSSGANSLDARDLNKLVKYGYVTLTSNHLNEIESHQYAISYPNCGSYLKLINAGRTWLVKLLSKAKFKEILEEQLWERWEGNSSNSHSATGSLTKPMLKMTNFRKPYYGLDLNWILADALGAGVVEVFTTPVGRGWKLTGKI